MFENIYMYLIVLTRFQLLINDDRIVQFNETIHNAFFPILYMNDNVLLYMSLYTKKKIMAM